jgi:hypothetical protein
VRYVYKVTIKNTYVLGAGEASHQVQPDIYKLYQGTSLFGSQDPELNWHFNNFDKYRIDWMEQLCVPTCRFPPNNGYGPLVNSNYYLDTQPEIMVNKSFDGPLRPDEGIMTWDEFSRAKDTFYVSPFKAFKVAMKPRMLCGIGQWSGGSATTAATFKFIGARPYDGWLDTTDLTYNLADKLPHQVGGWIIKTRPNGLHADIAFLCYNKLVISFKGRKKPTA